VLLLAVIAFGVPLALSLRDRVDAEVRGQARSQADVVAASSAELLGPAGRRTLDRLVDSSAASVRGRVMVVDETGDVVGDSAGPGELGVSYASRPEIEAALSGRSYQQERRSDTLNADILATAVPVLEHGATVGAVRVTQSVDAVNGAVRRSIVGIALLALVVLALGVVAGALIARRIARPIDRLAEAADEVAGGDLDARAPVEGSTEQRSLARSFNGMTDRVGRMLEGQREFVADASHQLRTPLTGLRLQLEEVESSRLDADGRGAADAALAEVDRLSAIVDELLVLSRAGEHDMPAEPIVLAEAADRAVARWERAAAARDVRLARDSRGPGQVVLCAGSDLDRAIDALVENAILYSRRGSEVVIADGLGTIEVLDRGPGLGPEEQEAVFDRFYRGSAGRRGPAGTGLGLPIARELAAGWGGAVRISNRDGGGARAVLELPLAPATVEADR
jgi:signal transduction histidine kinase